MSYENPIFTPPHPVRQPLPSAPPLEDRNRTVLVVVALFAVVSLAMCCGLGTLAYVGLKRVGQDTALVELPPRRGAFAEDAASFNKSLAQRREDPCDDAGVCEFVRRSAVALQEGRSVPFSRNMFLEAISKSERSEGGLSLMDRLTVQSWLAQGEPTPDSDEFFRILKTQKIQTDSQRDLARVDLLFYGTSNQSLSCQWFLVQEDGNWKLYDWQRMEFGRRMSDEYAGYVRGVAPRAEGYDEVLAELAEIDQQWSEGESKTAREALLACEQTPMLPGDLPVAQLQIAYTWLRQGENIEAVRVLENIGSPDQRWGVWPALAMAYTNQGEHQRALQILHEAERQSPHHPNVFWLKSEIYAALERTEEAADAAAEALDICPEDSDLFAGVVQHERPQDLPLLLDIVQEFEQEYAWTQLLDQASVSGRWGEALLEQLANREQIPRGVAELAAGNLAWSSGDYDSSAKHFLAARRIAEQPFFKETANRDYLSARLADERFEQLFAEADDPETAIQDLVQMAYDDELYVDNEKLLEALERQTSEQQAALAQSPWAAALRGWLNYTIHQPDQAVADFTVFADWLHAQEETLQDDQQWLVSVADYYLAQSLLELQRPLEVLQRWPDDVDRHEQLLTQLLRVREPSTLQEFLRATENPAVESVRLQRLRLMAELAMRDGDPQACEQLHQQAIDLARSVYDEDRQYQMHSLSWQRARDLVWNSDEMDESNRLLQQAGAHAFQILDADALHACLERAEAADDPDAELIAELQENVGELRLLEGRYDQAIEPLQSSLQHNSEETRWRDTRRRDSLLTALLHAGRFDDARTLLQEDLYANDSEIPDDAVIALARGDGETLLEMLKRDEAAFARQFGDHLATSEGLAWLEKYANQDWLDSMLRQVPMPIGYHTVPASGTLMLPREAQLTQAALERLLPKALGTAFQWTSIDLADPDADSQAWLATSEDGQRIVLHWLVASCHTRGLTDQTAVALLDEVRGLNIMVLDSQPNAAQRLFTIASAAAGPQAIGFWYPQQQWLWTAPDLKQQLRWEDRIPVGPQVASNPIFNFEPVSTQPASETETPSLTMDQWSQRLEAAGGQLDVVMTLSFGTVRESVPCVLLEVDADNYEWLVRPSKHSHLAPWIRQGVPYRYGPGLLELATTDTQ